MDQESCTEAALGWDGAFPFSYLVTHRERLVTKQHQLILFRGEAGLIAVNEICGEAEQWTFGHPRKPHTVEIIEGRLAHFLVEPFVLHGQHEENYHTDDQIK